MNKLENKLEVFLKKKRLWTEFKREFTLDRKNEDIVDYLDDTRDDELIYNAFIWSDTRKGFDYWSNINNLWTTHLER